MIEVIVKKSRYELESKTPTTMIHDTEHLTNKARAVLSLLEKWGMVQAQDAGEDSAGRAKVSLMPVDETVKRAIEMVDCAFTEMEKRDWIFHLPEFAEIQAMAGTKAEDSEYA